MLLVHDKGEIDAGDTIVFAEHDWEEQKAAERLSGPIVLFFCGALS
jgi:hypothetical protein